MIKPTLLLDQDGPLAAFDDHTWVRYIEEGLILDIEEPTQQRFHWLSKHLPDPAHRRRAREMIITPGWFASLPVTPGAPEGVAALEEAGVDIWVCTKPLEQNPSCLNDKLGWVQHHFPSLEHKLITTPNKAMVHGDVLLDDAIKPEWLPVATWKPLVFTRAWNQEGSDWADLPHWDWDQPLDALLEMLR